MSRKRRFTNMYDYLPANSSYYMFNEAVGGDAVVGAQSGDSFGVYNNTLCNSPHHHNQSLVEEPPLKMARHSPPATTSVAAATCTTSNLSPLQQQQQQLLRQLQYRA